MLAVATMASITQYVQYMLLAIISTGGKFTGFKILQSYKPLILAAIFYAILCDPRGTFIMLCSSSLIPRLGNNTKWWVGLGNEASVVQ